MKKTTKRHYALIAGISLVLMAIAAGFSFGYVHGNLVVPGDSFTSYDNLVESRSLFASGIAGWIVIFITDIMVALALYFYLKDVNRNISFIAAVLRLIYAVFLGAGIFMLLRVSGLLVPAETANSFLVSEYLDTFMKVWSLGLIVFGIHLCVLGYLSYRSKEIPRILGILLWISGLSYFAVHGARALLPAYEIQIASVEQVLTIPMALGEMIFAFWLMIRGGLKPKSRTSAPMQMAG